MDVTGIAYDREAWTRSESVVEPRSGASHYEDGFAHYLETVAAARGLWSCAGMPSPSQHVLARASGVDPER